MPCRHWLQGKLQQRVRVSFVLAVAASFTLTLILVRYSGFQNGWMDTTRYIVINPVKLLRGSLHPRAIFGARFGYESEDSPEFQWRCGTFEGIKNSSSMTDPCLLYYLRQKMIHPPSPPSTPYALTAMSVKRPGEFIPQIRTLFGAKTQGFFVECGANDGEFLSNTLDLERNSNWTGLLVEANPEMGKVLLTKKRKAWVVNACLSPYPNVSEFEMAIGPWKNRWFNQGTGELVLSNRSLPGSRSSRSAYAQGYVPLAKVKCFPLVSLLAAIKVTHVDYLTLDVQGVELNILKTLPFDDSLTIDVIQAEIALSPAGRHVFREFLTRKGYQLYLEQGDEIFFIRKDIKSWGLF